MSGDSSMNAKATVAATSRPRPSCLNWKLIDRAMTETPALRELQDRLKVTKSAIAPLK